MLINHESERHRPDRHSRARFSEKPTANLSQPVDKGSVASPVSQKFIRIYTSLQEWRQIYWAIVHRYPRDFPIPARSSKNFLCSKQSPIPFFPSYFLSTCNEKSRNKSSSIFNATWRDLIQRILLLEEAQCSHLFFLSKVFLCTYHAHIYIAKNLIKEFPHTRNHSQACR